MTELQAEDFRGLILTHNEAAQAGRIYRGLREAINDGSIPAGTLLNHGDLRTGCKAETAVITAALRGLTRTGLTGGFRVPPRPQPETRRTGETQTQYIERTVRDRIATGVYPAGSLLPPYRTLGPAFGVSAPLVQRALAPLLADGTLTSSRVPRGIRVAPGRRTRP